MAKTPDQHTDLRKAGLAVSLVVGLLLAAGVTVVVLMRKPPQRDNPASKPVAKPNQPEVTPDIANQGISTGTARVQFADKKDPSRAAGMIEWSKLEPLSQIEKILTEPRGYVYLRDGGLIVISSKSGRLNTTPKAEEPQSGRFEGGVTLKLYPAGYDPKIDQPTLTAESDSLDFDLPSASIATTGPFKVRSTSFDIDGSGMRMIANQVEEGIERFEVAKVKKVTIRPDAKDPVAAASLTPNQPARDTPNNRTTQHLRTYRAVISGAVKLTQAGRVMTADRVESWAHLVNNKLPAGAIGRLGPDPAIIGSCPDTGEDAILSADPDKPGKQATSALPPPNPNAPPIDNTITGEWTGPLVVIPVGETGENAQPAEFGANKLALRLHAGATPVKIQDPAFKGTLEAARIDFGATTRELAMKGTPLVPVQIHTADAGALTCTSATLNLGTGEAGLVGPGTLRPAASAVAKAAPSAQQATPATTLDFAKTLDLKFGTVGNWIDRTVRTAKVTGGFSATSGEINAAADNATVQFGPPIGPKGNERTPIENLRLTGHAVASAPATARSTSLTPDAQPKAAAKADPAARDTLKGNEMIVAFDTDPATGAEQPRSLVVTGDAQASAAPTSTGSPGLNLRARSITALLGKDDKGQTHVTSAEAREEVRVTDTPEGVAPRAGDIAASCDHLVIDTARNTAEMFAGSGTPAVPVTITRDGATMTGPKVTLSQTDGSVVVDGPGTVSKLSDGDDTKKDAFTSAFAAWQTSMVFNNKAGTATCTGNATAVMTTGDVEKNVVNAQTVVLSFPPAGAPAGKDAPAAKTASRELISAEAIGELGVDGKPPRPATLEHRRFSTVNGEQRIDRIAYLEGQRIVANQLTHTLDVPVPGKLLVDDRTPETTRPAPAPAGNSAAPITPPGGFTSGKGVSLFTWADNLHFDMTKGEATIKKDVQLTHQPSTPANAPQTTLDCDQLTAHLKINQDGKPAAGTQLEGALESVEARGHIVAKSEGKTLTASVLSFDTVKQIIEAAAGAATGVNDDQLLVTYLDPARPTPIRARKIIWNQSSGEIRIIEPAPTTIGN